MTFFHDEEDGPQEPAPGLPELLPEGERVRWQGSADPRALAIHAFHIRTITLYFGIAATLRAVADAANGRAAGQILETSCIIALLAGLVVGVLTLMAFFMARRSLFTITDKRVVIRHGIALKKYINLPFKNIAAASIRRHPTGCGDIAFRTAGRSVPYYHLWPFARPMRLTRTVPVLRALPDVDTAARRLTGAMTAAAPDAIDVAPHGLGEEPEKRRRPALEPEVSLS